MKKLICGLIGGGGYIGQQLRAFIKHRNIPIDIVRFSREKEYFESYADNNRIEKIDILLNLGSPNEVIARLGGHVADKAFSSWSNFFLKAIQESSPYRCIHISTFHIFDLRGGLIDESSPLSCTNAYGALHVKCLEYVQNLCLKEKVALTTIVPTNIYGTISTDLRPRNHLILNFAIDKLLKGEVMQLTSCGNGFRDFLWIEDALSALCSLIMEMHGNSHERFIIASENMYTLRDALHALFQVFGNGEFNSWCKFGSEIDSLQKFTISSNKLRSFIADWNPKTICTAAKIQKQIFG